MKRILFLSLCLFAVGTLSAQAPKADSADSDFSRGWYLGAQGGLSVGEADFSSFGADKFRAGWGAALHAGYRFNNLLSLELSARYGVQSLAEQDCCFDRGYWLGSDHNRYRYDLPTDMEGWYYTDLMSRTSVQRYGLQANVDMLTLFGGDRDRRWRVELSPAVYAVRTSSDLMTKADSKSVVNDLNYWHLGAGGQASVSYALTPRTSVALYGGFTHLFGDPMDGMPELHSTNFIADAGVKFTFAFGVSKRAAKGAVAAAVVPAVPAVLADSKSDEIKEPADVAEQVEPEISAAEPKSEPVATEPAEVEVAEPAEVLTVEPAEEEVAEPAEQVESAVKFPVIYFSFNSVWIEPSERAKVKEIADMMKADESIRVRITGWGDEVGGEEANRRVSLQRAEAVKRVLGQWLVPAERIETVGAGIAYDAPSREEARNATTIEIVE